jgi:hypothetical protein
LFISVITGTQLHSFLVVSDFKIIVSVFAVLEESRGASV